MGCDSLVSIGFTGTRLGMQSRQRQSLEVIMRILKPDEVHHGDCIGSDEQFHRLAQLQHRRIIIHPPENPKLRANCIGGIEVFPKPYMERNRDIVQASDIMLATPAGPEEQHSGTWMTIRAAKGLKKDVIIIFPGGDVEYRDHDSKRSMFRNEDGEGF